MMNNESDFIIRDKDEIIKCLDLVMKQNALWNLHFDERQSFITTLLDIDSSQNRILLDYGPKDYLNKKLSQASKIGVRTLFSGIKVAFFGHRVETSTHEGQEAFAMPIPEALLWLQRRQFYRVKSPLSKANYVQLMIEDGRPVERHLHDLSISGFSFLSETPELTELLTLNRIFNDSKLILENTGEHRVSFEVRNIVAINPHKPDVKKIGCKFTSLSSAFESKIQRHMQQIERENRKKE